MLVNNTNHGRELIKKLLPQAPSTPGVYLMYNSNKEIIYIGKAKNLGKRLTSYSKSNLRGRIARMIHQVSLIEYQLTNSEAEALLLEVQLIRKFQPRFNILLRKDKSASYIKLCLSHDFPRLERCYLGNLKDKDMIFGPFTSSYQADLIIAEVQRIFKLRPCSDSYLVERKRPCLEYEIGKCFAPCVGKISQENYQKLIKQAIDFLSSNIEKLLEELLTKMQQLSNDYFFEEAAIIRDRINLIKHSKLRIGKQYEGIIDADIIIINKENNKFQIKVLLYRGGQKWGEQDYFPLYPKESKNSEVLESFIGKFYQTRKPAKEIIINVPIQNPLLIIEALKKLYNIKTKFIVPKQGNKIQMLNDFIL